MRLGWAKWKLIALAALAFASASETVLASEPIRIGISLGLTGQYREAATMQRRGYELWRDDVNARGGISGRRVELVIRDDKSDPGSAEEIYREFVSGGSISEIFGPYSSQLTMAVAPIAEAAGFPMLAPGAAADDLWDKGYRNLFGVIPPASRYTQGMLRLAREAGLSTVAIIHAKDSFSQTIAQGTRKWAPFLKLSVVVDAAIGSDNAELSDGVRRARDARVDLVIVAGYLDEAVRVRQAIAGLAWSPRAFFATIGPALPEWKTIAGAEAEHTFATSIWEPNDYFAYPHSVEFAAAFHDRYGIEASYQAAAAYAAGQILEGAVATAKSLDKNELRAALSDLDLYTVLGRYAVDRTGMQVKRLNVIIQWQSGRKEIVWPEEIRTARAIFGRAEP